MRIERLTCSGLLSYEAETEIKFPSHAVIVGPNNSGKSNIFRIILIMLEALDGRQPAASQMSRAKDTAFAEAEMMFSHEERGLLSEFLGYYNPDSRPPRVAKHPDYEQIGEFLVSVIVRIGWIRDARGAGSAPRLTVSFPQCGFKLSGALGPVEFVVSSIDADGKFSGNPIDFPEFCAQVFQNKDPVSGFAKFTASGATAVHRPVSFLDEAIGNMESPEEKLEATALLRRLDRGRETKEWTLPLVLGSIMSGKIVHAPASGLPRKPFAEVSERLEEDWHDDIKFALHYNFTVSERLRALDVEYTGSLSPGGDNMAQFLFSLKNSPRHQDREAFGKIQDDFAEVFQRQLKVDVVLNHVWEKVGKSNLKFNVPSSTQVLFTDRTGSATTEQIGTGALQVLYLLAASHGIKESVVLLDEPGINLHPAMLQTIMGTVGAGQTESQFLIITHSPELLVHEVFDRGGDLIYVRKKGRSDAIDLWGDGGAGEWWRKERKRLKHQIDVRVFFANFVVLAEGVSDQSVLAGVAEYKADGDQKYNLARRNILIVRVDGKKNFPKYIRLLDSYKIPYVILADRDNDCDETHEELFGNKRTAEFPSDCEPFAGADVVLVEKNLEDMLKSMDKKAFKKAKKAGGGSKVAVAIEFCKTMGKDAEKLCRVTAFLDHCIERARGENDA